jgi:hypothetical protein
MGVVTGDAWDIILRLWPVLLIAIGLDGIFRKQGLAGAVLMIGLGTLFLLNNFGLLVFNTWDVILRLWPVLIIAAGFDLLIGRRSFIASILGAVLVLGILLASLWFSGVRLERAQAIQGEQIHQALEGASQARVIIEPGAASLHLAALPLSENLAQGNIAAARGQTVNQSYSVDGNQATLNIGTSGNTFFFLPGDSRQWDWNLDLNQDVPIDLHVNMGAGNADLDLSNMQLTVLDVDLAVGQTTVNLPASGQYKATVDGVIGAMTIHNPAEMGARIQASTALTNVQVPADYRREGEDIYTSPNYDSAENRVDLDVSQVLGQVVIRQ